MKRYLLIAVVGLALAGCQGGKINPAAAEKTVFQVETGYTAGPLNLAHQYWALPVCSDTQKQPCQDQDIANKLADADRMAEKAFEMAEKFVNDNPTADGTAAVAMARDAADAMAALLAANKITAETVAK